MAELESASTSTGTPESPSPGRSANEVALEMMKFIAVTTGYGKTNQSSSAGFSGKPLGHSAEEHAAALLELFDRCRQVVKKES
jgi:hypothetical protein